MRKDLWLAGLLFCTMYANAQDKKAEDNQQQAMVFYQNKSYEKAALLYEKLLEKDYKNTHLLTQAGLCYYYLENYEVAKEKFRLATIYGDVNNRENMALYYSNLSAAYSHLNDDNKAF